MAIDLRSLSREERADLDESVRQDMELMMRHDPVYTPAYLWFDSVTLNDPGTWLVHFTGEYFTKFRRGATLEGLHLSTYLRSKAEVECDRNLSPDVAPFEVVWGFALNVEQRENWSEMARNYGRDFVLFQTDCSVTAWHHGDQQWQTIFPLCTEYNVHTGTMSGSGEFVFGYEDPRTGDWEEDYFDTPAELVESMEG